MKNLEMKYDSIKALVVKKIAKSHNCTSSFVRQCIKENSDKHSALATDIRKEFRINYLKAKNALSKL